MKRHTILVLVTSLSNIFRFWCFTKSIKHKSTLVHWNNYVHIERSLHQICLCWFIDLYAQIVYPQGCCEVEQIVHFLVQQLHNTGISPLAEVTQGKRIADDGEIAVAINNFQKAKYIIILCTEETCKYPVVLQLIKLTMPIRDVSL